MIWATVSSWSCFCWLYRASPCLAAKNIVSLISVLTIWWCPCLESSLMLLEEGVCYDHWCIRPNSSNTHIQPSYITVLVARMCPTLCDLMDCSLPGSSVWGIIQARILECEATLFSKGSSWSRDWTHVFCIAGRFITIWVTKEAQLC